MNTFIANLKHAVRNRETVNIGGGEFEPAELAAVVSEIEHLQAPTARDDARAVAGAKNRPYPHYLEHVDILIDDVLFRLWVDFEPADRAVGLQATAWIVHAHVGDSPADIADYLNESTLKRLESEAADYLSGGD